MMGIPVWLTGAQILFLDAGLILTLLVGWRIALQVAGRVRSAIQILSPGRSFHFHCTRQECGSCFSPCRCAE